MKKIRTALCSFGMSGEVFHGPLLSYDAHYEIVKILERTKEKSKVKYPEASIVRSYEEILEDPSMDLVIVNTPHQLHYPMAKEALKRGKHVVVEKPFTVTTGEGQELIELAKQKGRVLTVFHNKRLEGDFKTIVQLIESKKLGELTSFKARFDRYKPTIGPKKWKEEDPLAGGILYDLGSHLIDQALYLFGTPKKIEADLRIERASSNVIDAFDISLEYKNGFKVELGASSLVQNPGPKFLVEGTLGTFIKNGVDPQEEDLKNGKLPGFSNWGKEAKEDKGILTYVNGDREAISTMLGSYENFYANLSQAIVEREPLLVLPDEALDVIKLIEQCK